jgi:hypothetical protein
MDSNAKQQPWKGFYERIKSSTSSVNTATPVNKVIDFKEGDVIVLGGQSGAVIQTLYDTNGSKPQSLGEICLPMIANTQILCIEGGI